MEALVLCPEELCLGPVRSSDASASGGIGGLMGVSPAPADLTLFTSDHVDKGTRFVPWKGTVRSDKLPQFDKLPEFDIRHRFGVYDEISSVPSSPLRIPTPETPSTMRQLRQCNWIRFLRYALVYSDAVNVVGTKSGPTGEPVFEVIKDLTPKTEIVAFFVPERPEEAFLLPAIQYLRHTLFKRLIDNVLEESPLDLSTSLLSPGHHYPQAHAKAFPVSPTSSEGGRKSVSSDCTEASSASTSVPISMSSMASASAQLNNFLPKNLMPPSFAAFAAAAAANAALKAPTPVSRSSPLAPPHALSVEALVAKSNTITTPIVSPSKPTPLPKLPNAVERSLSSPVVAAAVSAAAAANANNSSKTGRAPVARRREKNMLPCSYCGKAFDRPSLLKRHVRIHTGERPHVCDICSKGFSTSSSLNTHRRIHSGEKPHQCGVCGKRFTASSNLYYHKMTHVKEKPHKCTMCSKSFPTPGDLKSHTYVHTGTWPFKCHICHRGFSKQTNLKNHLLLHSGDKPFSCDICQKKFALSCNLRAHLKTHESEYQNSTASLALYQRALAVLGDRTSPVLAVEDMETEEEASSSRASESPKREDDIEEEEEVKADSPGSMLEAGFTGSTASPLAVSV